MARELASHLRLKRVVPGPPPVGVGCGEGTGFSSEIETQIFALDVAAIYEVARELASHLRLKR